MFKKIFVVLLVLLQVFTVIGCRSQGSDETRIFTDSAGRKVEIPTNIERIAVSGQMAQMFIFPIAADKLVGLGGPWSEDAKLFIDKKYLDLPVFGQFYGSADLNLEEVIAADPQIIIDVGEKKDSIVTDMDSIAEQTGIPTVFIEANFDNLANTYTMLGDLLDKKQEAKELADYCQKTFDKTKTVLDQIGEEGKVKILYLTGDKGLNVIAKGSFHSQTINFIAKNAADLENPSSKGSGNETSMEQIMLWDPDYIIFSPDSVYEEVGSSNVWAQLKAIANNKYYEAPGVPYNWMGFPPSINMIIGQIWMCETFYPDRFDYDLKSETVNFYKLFYHCDLTDEMYDKLTKNAIR